jgi:hypothetical protein
MNTAQVNRTDELRATMNGLYLFKALMKVGAQWHGDVIRKQWSECLYVTDVPEHQLKLELEFYEEGKDYKLSNGRIWIY